MLMCLFLIIFYFAFDFTPRTPGLLTGWPSSSGIVATAPWRSSTWPWWIESFPRVRSWRNLPSRASSSMTRKSRSRCPRERVPGPSSRDWSTTDGAPWFAALPERAGPTRSGEETIRKKPLYAEISDIVRFAEST